MDSTLRNFYFHSLWRLHPKEALWQRTIWLRLITFVITGLSLSCVISSAPATPPSTGEQPGWYDIYFTDPSAPNSRRLRGGPDQQLADAIRQAQLSVDVAVYEFNLWSVRDALLDAQRRGLTVRVVAESDNLDTKEIRQLLAAGIPVLGDRREGLMHHKFVVIDRQEVWSGSMNFTTTDGYRNHNNLVRLRSSPLAENYLTEFNEMFVDDLFGPGSPANTPFPRFTIEGTPVEVYFSPEDGVLGRLVELVMQARQSIHFMAFSFTQDDLADAMIARASQGVSVRGVLDESQYQSNIGSEYDRLMRAGVDVRLDGNSNKMHHKVIVIDDQLVITGSYNFTYSAENKNDEDVLILHDPQMASAYLAEFQQIWQQAR